MPLSVINAIIFIPFLAVYHINFYNDKSTSYRQRMEVIILFESQRICSRSIPIGVKLRVMSTVSHTIFNISQLVENHFGRTNDFIPKRNRICRMCKLLIINNLTNLFVKQIYIPIFTDILSLDTGKVVSFNS